MDWFVIYTKPRWEIKVTERLLNSGIEAYCPTIVEIRQWSDRKKKVKSPLFNSFVFVRLEEKDRQKVFEIPGVVRYLFWLEKPAVVRDDEIKTIKTWLDNDVFEEIQIENLKPGEEVTINNGSFKGQKAIITESGKKRLRLVLKSLNCVVNVKIKDVI